MQKVCAAIFASLAIGLAHAEAVQKSPSPQEAKIDQFAWDGPQFLKNKSFTAIRSLAPLKRDVVKKEKNRFVDGAVTEFHTLVFDGLEIYGYVRSPGELSLITVTVTNGQWHIAQGLNVGASANKVTEVLGTPNETTDNAIAYHGETEMVSFQLNKGRVSKIRFDYYAD